MVKVLGLRQKESLADTKKRQAGGNARSAKLRFVADERSLSLEDWICNPLPPGAGRSALSVQLSALKRAKAGDAAPSI
jgi:hypothetical protein